MRNLCRNAFDSPLGSVISAIGVISRPSLALSWMDGRRKQLIELTVCAQVSSIIAIPAAAAAAFPLSLSLYHSPCRSVSPSLLQQLSIPGEGKGGGAGRERERGRTCVRMSESCVAKPRSFLVRPFPAMRMKEMRLAIKSPLEEGHPS